MMNHPPMCKFLIQDPTYFLFVEITSLKDLDEISAKPYTCMA